MVFSLTQYLLVCENFGKSGVCCVLSGSGLLVALLAFQNSVIPGNDDAIRAVKLISGAMADAVLEGKQGKQDAPAAEEAAKAE